MRAEEHVDNDNEQHDTLNVTRISVYNRQLQTVQKNQNLHQIQNRWQHQEQ